MPLFAARDRPDVEAFGAINRANPFLSERVELERRILGDRYVEVGAVRSLRPEAPGVSPNFGPLLERAEALLERARTTLESGRASAADEELERYEDLAIYTLYHRWIERFVALVAADAGPRAVRVEWYEAFQRDALVALRPGGRRLPLDLAPEHLVSLLFQVARTFERIFDSILGASDAAARLRAAIWQSTFTHDIRRYQRALYRRMADVSTLVTGPSGTGKELVARAVGSSLYVPFDRESCSFRETADERFLPLNLSALSPTLIESELFGHARGAFTGAADAREGWFEQCSGCGAVFLDEIGEIAPEIQVKLLRVLQTRTFQRLGDTRPREFRGKLVSATNRDLDRQMADGAFREDLYYRICSDRIVTPPLAEQLAGSLDELEPLAVFVAQKLVGDEAPELAREVVEWVDGHLGADYAWPGNFRELEQCVRSVLIRKDYRPGLRTPAGVRDVLGSAFLSGEQTAERVLRAYCTIVYARVGTFEGAARTLGLDRRTVKAKVDEDLLAKLRAR